MKFGYCPITSRCRYCREPMTVNAYNPDPFRGCLACETKRAKQRQEDDQQRYWDMIRDAALEDA